MCRRDFASISMTTKTVGQVGECVTFSCVKEVDVHLSDRLNRQEEDRPMSRPGQSRSLKPCQNRQARFEAQNQARLCLKNHFVKIAPRNGCMSVRLCHTGNRNGKVRVKSVKRLEHLKLQSFRSLSIPVIPLLLNMAIQNACIFPP